MKTAQASPVPTLPLSLRALSLLALLAAAPAPEAAAPKPKDKPPEAKEHPKKNGFNKKSANTVMMSMASTETRNPVSPVLEKCIDNGNGTYTAFWGYYNRNGFPVSIPVGQNNRFVGHAQGQNLGQPVDFTEGRHRSVFSTVWPGENLVWVLDNRTATANKRACKTGCAYTDSVLKEDWTTLDTLRWRPDIDATVDSGLFVARPDAYSAFARWRNAAPLSLNATSVLHFASQVRLDQPAMQDNAFAGLLFYLDRDGGDTSQSYVFADVGYTFGPDSKLYVEIYGADGGEGFDQFVETPITWEPNKRFNLDIRVTQYGYAVAIDGIVVNSITLQSKMDKLSTFEVGVQQVPEFIRGAVDNTSIYFTCQ